MWVLTHPIIHTLHWQVPCTCTHSAHPYLRVHLLKSFQIIEQLLAIARQVQLASSYNVFPHAAIRLWLVTSTGQRRLLPLPRRDGPGQVDIPWGHHAQEILYQERCVELWDTIVRDLVARDKAISGHVKSRGKETDKRVSKHTLRCLCTCRWWLLCLQAIVSRPHLAALEPSMTLSLNARKWELPINNGSRKRVNP